MDELSQNFDVLGGIGNEDDGNGKEGIEVVPTVIVSFSGRCKVLTNRGVEEFQSKDEAKDRIEELKRLGKVLVFEHDRRLTFA